MPGPERALFVYVPERRTPFAEPVRRHQLDLMHSALRPVGWHTREAAFDPDRIVDVLNRERPDIVFDLAYGWTDGDGLTLLQPEIAAILGDHAALVGSGPEVQQLCQDKRATAAAASELGVPVPAELDPIRLRTEPVVVKPRYGAAHRDVRVVEVGAELAAGPDEIVQEYVDGPEFTIAVLERGAGPEPLPAARVRFGREAVRPRLYDWMHTTVEPVASSRFGLGETAALLFDGLGLRDYARFDFRVGPHGPVLLDANSLPSLAPRALLAVSARWDGIGYDELIRLLAVSARRRRH